MAWRLYYISRFVGAEAGGGEEGEGEEGEGAAETHQHSGQGPGQKEGQQI